MPKKIKEEDPFEQKKNERDFLNILESGFANPFLKGKRSGKGEAGRIRLFFNPAIQFLHQLHPFRRTSHLLGHIQKKNKASILFFKKRDNPFDFFKREKLLSQKL